MSNAGRDLTHACLRPVGGICRFVASRSKIETIFARSTGLVSWAAVTSTDLPSLVVIVTVREALDSAYFCGQEITAFTTLPIEAMPVTESK